jgi:DNA end-binding protein Ku
MAARAIGSGTISFGLVSIPFKLYTATSAQNVSFNMLHKKCGGRMKQQYLCPIDNEIVERSDMVKGYEHAKERYVQFTDEELKKLEAERSDRLEIVEFVPEPSVDFVYIEKTYYLGPDKGGDRAYKLLSDAMKRMDKIAVGRWWGRGKEQLVLVRPYRGGLALHQVYYADEVRSIDDVDRPSNDLTFKPVEEELADLLIEQLSVERFDASLYKDEYRDRVMAAVEQKVAGQEITVSTEAPQAQIIDLFEALKKSLGAAKAADKTAAANDEGAAADGAAEPAAEDAKKPLKKAAAAKAVKQKKGATG